jgi:hypothetical protein
VHGVWLLHTARTCFRPLQRPAAALMRVAPCISPLHMISSKIVTLYINSNSRWCLFCH